MKLTCYGTAAAEAIPGLFCSCPICENARSVGGKEIRSRHLSTVDDVIQFDIGPDFFYHIHAHGLEPRRIRHLIITHTHGDHFDTDTLDKRARPFSLKLDAPMQVIGSQKTIDIVKSSLQDSMERQGLAPIVAAPFETLALDTETSLVALPANHAPGLGAMMYVIERNGKSLLYAHDTGPFLPEALSWLSGRRLNAVSLDCTGVFNGAGDHHMTLCTCAKMVDAMQSSGALKPGATVVINHFSHGGGASHAQLEKEAADRGWIAAFDGIEIEI